MHLTEPADCPEGESALRVTGYGFDPEVTTGGHGYGVLTVARTALALRNGSLTVASQPGCTRFVIAWDRE